MPFCTFPTKQDTKCTCTVLAFISYRYSRTVCGIVLQHQDLIPNIIASQQCLMNCCDSQGL